jgi:peptide methionine sulfoxide reductase MsrB
MLKRHRFTDYPVKRDGERWLINRASISSETNNALDMTMRKRKIPQVRQAVTTLLSRIGK